jgi:hypothetical protein
MSGRTSWPTVDGWSALHCAWRTFTCFIGSRARWQEPSTEISHLDGSSPSRSLRPISSRPTGSDLVRNFCKDLDTGTITKLQCKPNFEIRLPEDTRLASVCWVFKETYYSVKRDLLQCQKRPTTVSKETYYSGGRHQTCKCVLSV